TISRYSATNLKVLPEPADALYTFNLFIDKNNHGFYYFVLILLEFFKINSRLYSFINLIKNFKFINGI
ncbi:MAG TPA: hypothetical protein DEP28_07070, partial [Bacteroidetes bacterium]|nr:hypothetical protein [Bacteroidota bacterium]